MCRSLSIAMTLGAVGLADIASGADQKQVLVLYSTRRDAQIAVVGDRDLPLDPRAESFGRPGLLLRIHRPGEVLSHRLPDRVP
jgi:hypothetical protein